MASRLYTSSIGQLIPNVFLNYVQDLVGFLRPAKYGDLSSMSPGIEGRLWQATTDVADNNLLQVDNTDISVINTGVSPMALTTGSISWYDREIRGLYRNYAGSGERPGQANDYLLDAAAPVVFWGYLGRGALDGGGLSPSAGNPPVPAAGTSWAVQIGYPSITGLWLYIDPADGGLRLYNDTGSTQRTPSLWFEATAPLGVRP